VEENLDEIAPCVKGSIARKSPSTLGLGIDHGLETTGADLGTKLVRVVAGVSDERGALRMIEQLRCGDQLVTLARRERDVDWPRFAVDEGVDLS